MKPLKPMLTAFAALIVLGGPAFAGPNANGTLMMALAVDEVYTNDIETYCGFGPDTCEEGVVRHDDPEPIVINVLAAFPNGASPRLAGVTFGLSYDENIFFLPSGFGSCGDFELATSGWPGSGEGTAVTWSTAQTGEFVDVYWLAAYDYYGNPSVLALTPHPTQGANFADDDVPSNIDPIGALGTFGFFTDGDLACPIEGPPGACCFPDGECEVLRVEECEEFGGEFQGEGTDCQTVQCPQPPTGGCCIADECVIRTEQECEVAGGDYLGDGTACEDGCPVPTIESSWGSVKRLYR